MNNDLENFLYVVPGLIYLFRAYLDTGERARV